MTIYCKIHKNIKLILNYEDKRGYCVDCKEAYKLKEQDIRTAEVEEWQ